MRDSRVARLVDCTTVAEADRHNERFPQSRTAEVQITLRDGRVFDSGDVHARGGPEAPMSEDEVIAKFMEFATPSLGEARAAQIRDATLGLTYPDSFFLDLRALIYDAPDP